MRLLSFVALALSIFVSSNGVAEEKPTPDTPHFNRVMIVILENTDMKKALKQPFLSSLVKRGTLLSNYYAVGRPSQPNYLALIGGSTFGVHDDSNVDLRESHLGDLLEANHRTWKTYAEAYPGECFLGARSKTYVRKHNPFLSFTNVQSDARRCSQVVAADELDKDLEKNSLPDFSFYIPDLNNDGHDTGVEFADKKMNERFGKLLKDENFLKGMLFVLTFDEGGLFSNHIYTALIGSEVKKDLVTNEHYDHYNLLRTIEEEWQLGTLHRKDEASSAIKNIWNH